MRKRMLVWVMILALVLSFVPAISLGVAAEGEETHTDHTGWTKWTDTTKLPTAAGKYYLDVDVKLTAAWSPAAGHVQLCLNGHTVTQTAAARAAVLNANRELSVYDCAEAYDGDGNYVGGKIVGATHASNAMIIVARGSATAKNAVLNLYGGRICGNRPSKTGISGGAVYLQTGKANAAGGVFNMYGGELYDNEAQFGGAISIPGETAANRGDKPAAFHMYGGKIHGNTSSTGTIYATNDGIVDIRGGQIVNNTSGVGAAIFAQNDNTVNLYDVEITGNTSTTVSDMGSGSAVHLRGATTRLTLGGKVTVANNTNACGCDIIINSEDGKDIETVYVDGLTGGVVYFAVKDKTVTEASQVVAFAGTSTDYTEGVLTFVDGTQEKLVGLEDGKFVFVEGHVHNGVVYKPWTDTTKLPSSGNYYLTDNVTVTKDADRGTVEKGAQLHLCLNGKTVSGNNTVGRAFHVKDGSLYLNDCTTVYDAEGYFVSGGKITGWTMPGSGAALYADNVASVIEITGIEFSGNVNTGTNADYGGGAIHLRENTTAAKVTGCLFEGNTATKTGGGALHLRPRSKMTLDKCVITGNTAGSYGAAYARDAELTFNNCKITNNIATGGVSAVYVTGAATVTFHNTEVTGNQAQGTTVYGAVYAASSKAVMTLSGSTVITGNTVKGGKAQNVCLYNNSAAVYDVSGLTEGANVGISLMPERINAGLMYFTTTGMTANSGYCVSDEAAYVVELDDSGRLALVDASSIVTHSHKLCSDDACTEHNAVSFKAWDKTDSLPTTGNWYLTGNVELTAAVNAEDLNLCLNGFTVTQKTNGQRILNVGNAANSVTVSLCDCQGTGVLTGGTATYGSAVSIRHKSTFNLFGGKLTGNTSTSEGTVYMQGKTPCANTFNMYGGEISGNTNRVGGAVSVGAPNANITNIPTVNIYGGKIQGNTATQSGGAIHTSGALNLTIAGGEISGNTAATQGGAVNLGEGAKLNLTGGKIVDNEAPKGAGIYAGAKVAGIAVAGDPVVTGNTASGKLNNLYLEGELTMTLGELDANASIGITAVKIGRVISSQTDKDYTANFQGDNSKMSIIYKENALWIDNRVETSDHYHCVCDGVKAGTCDHAEHMWIKWGDDDDEIGNLPTTSGYYYLVSDVEMTAFAFPTQGQEIYLCLNGKTVKAAENDRHFNVSNGTVYTITDCALEMGGFTGGNRTFGGSVNINAGGTMNLYAGRFYGNNAPDSEGGAIYLQRATTLNGGVLNMYGGEISGNTALFGAGIRAAGMNAGAAGAASIVNIYGGLITDNHTGKLVKVNETTGKESVTYGHGGGIDTEVGSVLNIYGGTVSGNSSQYNGGGIHMVETTFLMEGGNISGNTAVNYGGGFFDSRGKVTLKGGTISGNDATARGGAFVANGTVMDIYGMTISGNTSKEGAVAYMNLSNKKVDGVVTVFPAQITVHDGAVFTGNKATASAGTFLVANPDVKLIIEGGEMTKNTAANGGAIMIWKGATALMKGGKLSNNTVNLGIGGAVYASNDSRFVMEGGTISGNSARLGGAIYGDRCVIDLNGGSITGNTVKCKMTWSKGKEVKSGGQGAALYVQGTTLNIRGASITYNRAESNGGGVVMTQQAVTKNGVKTVYLAKTNMTGGTISYNYSGAAAGGMLIQSAGTVTNIYGGTFVGNECKATGGAIYVSTKSTLNMTGGTIRNNKSNNSGGGLYVAQGTANISNVTFQNNESVNSAAHLMVNGDQCVVTAKNCKFLEGKTKTAGALVQSKAHAIFENCDFGNNEVNTGSGAGLYVSTRSYANLVDCKFYNNVSPNNAGALMLSNYAEVSVTGSDFTENSSDTLGGATYVSPAATLNLTDCKFNKCTSAGRGGAIACRGNINMTGCVVENCTAATEGGGITTDVNTMGGSGIMKGMVIKDTIIRNNTAGGQGGGIYGWKGCRLEIYDSQITGNTSPADGGAIWAYEDLELHNTKITGNTSGGEGYAVYMNDANFDGHSYMASKNKLSGNTIIRDNEGKNLYMGPDVVFAITGEGLGEDAYIELVLAEGYVTHQIQGAFHYEGGNQEYIVTYGNRSIVEPEYDPNLVPQEETQEEKKDDTAKSDIWLYVGVGAVALIVLAVVAVLILKKKKTPEATKD